MGSPSITPNNGQLPEPTNPPLNNQIPLQQQQPMQSQIPQRPTPQQMNQAHDSIIGRAFKTLSGQDTQYSIDPQTGKTITTKVQNTPGQFFRNVVAAALLGGAAGSEGGAKTQGSGLAAAMRGGQAEIDQNKQLDQQRIEQAQQQYQNQQRAEEMQMKQAEAQRQAQGFQTEEQLRKAQIASANAETLKTNLLTQGANFTQHQDVANAGMQHFSDYKTAGLQPIAENVSESDMQNFIKNRPGASAYDWEATGVKASIGADGKPAYEYTYSAYDPKGKIPVSKGTLDQWKTDGMDKFYPDLFNNVKPGRELDAQQYIAIKKLDTQLYNENLIRQKNQTDTDEAKQKLNESRAATARDYAAASKDRADADASKLGKKQSEQFGVALKELDDVGGDFDKLKPSSKVVIGESATKLIGGLDGEIKQALDDGDEDKAKDLMKQEDQLRGLTMGAFTTPRPRAPGAAGPAPTRDQLFDAYAQKLSQLPPDDVASKIANDSSLSAVDKKNMQSKVDAARKQQNAQTRQNIKTGLSALPGIISNIAP